MRAFSRLVLLGAIGLAGCNGGGPLDQAVGNSETFVGLVCDECYGVTGATSSEQCSGMFEALSFDDAERACLDDLIERDEAARAYVECFADLTGDIVTCLDAANDECDAEAMQACVVGLQPGVTECQEMHLTASAADAFDDCVD